MSSPSIHGSRPVARIKRPIYAFKRCPFCGSNRVNEMGDDHNVFCGDCSWDSMNVYAELQAKAGQLKYLQGNC